MVTTIICLIFHPWSLHLQPAGIRLFYCFSKLPTNIDTYQVTFGAGDAYRAYQAVLRKKIKGAPETTPDQTLGFTAGKNLIFTADASRRASFQIGRVSTDSDTSMTVSGYIPVDPTQPYCVDLPWKAATDDYAKGVFISRQYDSSYFQQAASSADMTGKCPRICG
ncbi:hypothetical protein V6S18_25675 [Klebsiella pneumoniae]